MGIVIAQSGIAQAVIATVKLTTDWNGPDEPEVEELLAGSGVREGRDDAVPESVALRRLADRGLDVRVEENACALPLDVRRCAGEVEGGGQDRKAHECDQQAGPRCDQGGEDGEPEDSDDEIEDEVEGLEVGAALS